jgi:hypothetical protein
MALYENSEELLKTGKVDPLKQVEKMGGGFMDIINPQDTEGDVGGLHLMKRLGGVGDVLSGATGAVLGAGTQVGAAIQEMIPADISDSIVDGIVGLFGGETNADREKKAKENQARIEKEFAEKKKIRLEAEKKAAEEKAKKEVEDKTKQEAEKKAAEEKAKQEAEKKAPAPATAAVPGPVTVATITPTGTPIAPIPVQTSEARTEKAVQEARDEAKKDTLVSQVQIVQPADKPIPVLLTDEKGKPLFPSLGAPSEGAAPGQPKAAAAPAQPGAPAAAQPTPPQPGVPIVSPAQPGVPVVSPPVQAGAPAAGTTPAVAQPGAPTVSPAPTTPPAVVPVGSEMVHGATEMAGNAMTALLNQDTAYTDTRAAARYDLSKQSNTRTGVTPGARSSQVPTTSGLSTAQERANLVNAAQSQAAAQDAAIPPAPTPQPAMPVPSAVQPAVSAPAPTAGTAPTPAQPVAGTKLERFNQVKSDLQSAAATAGVNAGTLAKITNIESGFKTDAQPISKSNPSANKYTPKGVAGAKAGISSAYGLGQFLNSTWEGQMMESGAKYGVKGTGPGGKITADDANRYRNDPKMQAAMLAEYSKKGIQLGQKYGLQDQDAAVYAHHNLGEGGAKRLFEAVSKNPNAPITQVLTADEIKNNPSMYKPGMTAKQAFDNLGSKMREGEGYAQQMGTPTLAQTAQGAVTGVAGMMAAQGVPGASTVAAIAANPQGQIPSIAPPTGAAPTAAPTAAPQGQIPPATAGAATPLPPGARGIAMKTTGANVDVSGFRQFNKAEQESFSNLNTEFAGRISDLAAKYKAATGKELGLGESGGGSKDSLYRSVETQQQLKAQYGANAAKPGYSAHGLGLAADLDQKAMEWAANTVDPATGKSYLESAGLARVAPNKKTGGVEKWHVTPSELGAGMGQNQKLIAIQNQFAGKGNGQLTGDQVLQQAGVQLNAVSNVGKQLAAQQGQPQAAPGTPQAAPAPTPTPTLAQTAQGAAVGVSGMLAAQGVPGAAAVTGAISNVQKGGKTFSADVESAISAAAQQTGVPLSYMRTMANIESSGNASAHRAGSKYTGLYQFDEATAAGVGVQDRNNASQAALGAAKLAQKNIKALAGYGINVDINKNPELAYLAHQQGAKGAADIIKAAQTGGPVSDRLRKTMDANGGKGMTAAQFLDHWKSTYSKKASQVGHGAESTKPGEQTQVAAAPQTPAAPQVAATPTPQTPAAPQVAATPTAAPAVPQVTPSVPTPTAPQVAAAPAPEVVPVGSGLVHGATEMAGNAMTALLNQDTAYTDDRAAARYALSKASNTRQPSGGQRNARMIIPGETAQQEREYLMSQANQQLASNTFTGMAPSADLSAVTSGLGAVASNLGVAALPGPIGAGISAINTLRNTGAFGSLGETASNALNALTGAVQPTLTPEPEFTSDAMERMTFNDKQTEMNTMANKMTPEMNNVSDGGRVGPSRREGDPMGNQDQEIDVRNGESSIRRLTDMLISFSFG